MSWNTPWKRWPVRLLLAAAGASGAAACGVDERKPNVGEEFTRHLTYGVEATPQVDPLPAGLSTGPQVVSLTDTATVVAPGEDIDFAVGWQGGPITSVNMSFTQNQYFSIPVPLASAELEGVANIPARLDAAVCDALADVCHPITCLEQVVTAEGNVSVARARTLVLDCLGNGCGETGMGATPPGDPCDETAECIPGSVCFNEYCVGAGSLRVSLAFEVDSDFDLHVQTPSGDEIFFLNRTADGGELDVDQCIQPCGTEAHAENVVFDGSVLPGRYEVWVVNFDGRAAGDFTIQVAGDVTETFTGSLPATSSAESTRYTFTL